MQSYPPIGRVEPCQDCGVEGVELPNDVAPGLCPGCFGARLNRVTDRMRTMIAGGCSTPTILNRMRLLLRNQAGMTEIATENSVSKLATLLGVHL